MQPWRASLGLPPLQHGVLAEYARAAVPTLIAASELMCGPRGKAPSDFPAHVYVGGFLFAQSAERARAVPARAVACSGGGSGGGGACAAPAAEPRRDSGGADELLAFLTARAAPAAYFGFGSMPAPDSVELLRLVLGTCAAARCRALLVAGWTSLSTDAACVALVAEATAAGTLIVRQSVDHAAILPLCSAIVHHCGVGTFAAALRSGVPQVPSPFMLDQPYNAQLAVRLGVAPEVVPFDTKISAAKLARALRTILDEEGGGPLCERARAVAEQVRAESAHTVEHFVAAVEGAGLLTPSDV